MGKDLNSRVEKVVESFAELSNGWNAIGKAWLYQKKLGSEDSIHCYKDQTVARVFSQRNGIDYGDIYDPVVRYSNIRFVLATAAKLN